ncbi:hypothetical protein ACUOFC_59835, partial [Escherichia sp. TWPC-MK]
VFQDSISAVNPRKTVREILREPMRHLLSLKKSEQLARASEMLKAVDLDDSVLDKRPPQLSGGQLHTVEGEMSGNQAARHRMFGGVKQ